MVGNHIGKRPNGLHPETQQKFLQFWFRLRDQCLKTNVRNRLIYPCRGYRQQGSGPRTRGVSCKSMVSRILPSNRDFISALTTQPIICLEFEVTEMQYGD